MMCECWLFFHCFLTSNLLILRLQMPPTQNIFYNVRVMYFICLWVTPLELTGLPSPQQGNLGSETIDSSAALQGFWLLNLWPCHCEELFQFAALTPSPATEHLEQPKLRSCIQTPGKSVIKSSKVNSGKVFSHDII